LKKFQGYFFLLIVIIFYGFAFLSGFPGGNSGRITNYYYFQGEKFFLQERTDMVFLKFKTGITQNSAFDILSKYPQFDLNLSQINTDDDNFIRLKNNFTESEYIEFINRLKLDESFDNVSYAYSPYGRNDEKTFFGLNNNLILQFKPSYSLQQIEDINRNFGVQIIQKIDVTGGETFLAKVTGNSQMNAMETANRYYENGYVNYSEPSLYFTNARCDTVNDPFYPMQWALRNTGSNVPTNPPNIIADADMDVDSAWNITKGDSNIVIAILDTGVDTTHPDLRRVYGYDFVNNDGNPDDDGNHGTACAGIVAAIGNNNLGVTGIAYRCKIMPIKMMNAAGNVPGYHVPAFGTIWAYQHGADVMSNSWGIVGGNSSLLLNAINDAARFGRNGKGTVMCYASGNEDTSPMRFPAIYQGIDIIVVGGLTPCNKRKSPTDGCSLETWGACYGSTLDIVAPCMKIYTTDRVGPFGYNGTDYTSSFNGTSSATPNAAGVCALLLSANPDLKAREVEALISLSAEKVGGYSYSVNYPYGLWNNEMGYGRLNARLSLGLISGLVDRIKPEIFHDSPLVSGPDSLARTVTAVIRDNKIVAGGANAPRLYYRINGGSFNSAIAFFNSADTFQFSIPAQVQSTVIDYYIAAQDTALIPNVATLPTGGSGINPPGTNQPNVYFTYIVGRYKIQKSVTTPKVCINNSFILDTINITGLSGNVIDVDVRLNISTRDAQDADVFLIKGVNSCELTSDNGGTGDGYVNTIFDDEAQMLITQGAVPFTGRFKPEAPLTVFDGMPIDGSWILQYIDDSNNGYNSSLDSWTIELTYETVNGINQTITIPSEFSLSQNYPNPFNPVTKITYGLPKNEFVKLKLFDITGKEITVLVNENKQAGIYEFDLNSEKYSLSSGVYFYRLEAGNFTAVQKMVLLK